MRPLRRSAVAALAAAGLALPLTIAAGPAGPALSNAAANASFQTAAASGTASRVVVAPVDSGINPYHDVFQVETSAVTQDVLDEFAAANGGTPVVVKTLTDYDADVDFWQSVVPGVDYHFTGTNIIARSFSPGSVPILPDDESDTHGTGVSNSVVIGNEDAIIYFHEGLGDDASTAAFTNPVVDIVTTSYGLPTGVPGGPSLGGSYTGVVENGKIHAGAATNDPSLVLFDGTSGPWWSIGIAGYEEGTAEGKQLLSGTFPDVVGDFTQDIAYCMSCTTETRDVSGTSFATPLTAGILSDIVLSARERVGHVGGIKDGLLVNAGDTQLSTWDVRRAFEEGVAIPTAEGDPIDQVFETAVPVNPIAPYAQIGWGLASTDPELDVVNRTLAVLLEGAEGDKSQETCDYMSAHFAARSTYWASIPTSEGFLDTDSSAYIAC